MRFPKRTIRTKITLALLCAMLPLVAAGLYSIGLTANALEKNALAAAAEEVFLKAKRIERFLKNSQSDFLFLMRTPALRALVDALGDSEKEVAFWREKVEQEFLAFSLNRKIYRQIVYADENGREIVRIDSDGTKVWVANDTTRNRHRKPYDAIRSEADAREHLPPGYTYSISIFDSRRRRKGVLTTSLFPYRLLEMVQEGRIIPGERIYLVHQDGFCLAQAENTANPREARRERHLRERYLQEITTAILSGEPGTISKSVDAIISYAPIPIFPASGKKEGFWVLVDAKPKSFVLASAKRYKKIFLITTIGALGLMVLISHVLARLLTKPLTELRDGARRIGSGDLDYRLSLRTHDEIEQVAGEFNRMADQLRAFYSELEARIREKTEALEKTHQRLVQSEKLAGIGTLAAGVAHEINNPLDGILNCIARIRKKPGDAGQLKNYLDLMTEALLRIGTVVRQLLDFSRRHELSLQPTDLGAVVEEALSMADYNLRESAIALEKDLAPNAPPIMGDAHHLQQVFLNLTLNAIAAMPDGGTLRVRSIPSADAVGLLCVEIQDTGMGIPEDRIDRIFDPFYTTKAVGQGTGLGLSVSFNIIKEHHGTIEVESIPGEGTTFRVKLPIGDW
jgi:signal transduction histidine kinase